MALGQMQFDGGRSKPKPAAPKSPYSQLPKNALIPDGYTYQQWNKKLTGNSASAPIPGVVSPPQNKGSGQTVKSVGPVKPAGPSASELAAQKAAREAEAARKKAEEELAKQKKAGKDQTAKENKATQAVIDQLLGTLKGYETGRDTQIKNASTNLDETLRGILENYKAAITDYTATGLRNEQDQAGKAAANITNRARERVSLLQQAATQGAGETDQLRAQLQAFLNSDANQQEIDAAFYDTQRSVLSQIAGANSQQETQRRSAETAYQEALGSAWNDFWKNTGDVFTNVQRTAAQNTNINSDYSTEFKADFKGYDPVKEAAKYAGKAYKEEEKPESWYKNWAGRTEGKETKTSSTNRAAATTIKAPKAAEGATLRGKW